MILESLHIGRAELERRTGWTFKPEGACKGETCVPLPWTVGDEVNVTQLADRLKMPLLHDRDEGLWCLGPESGGRALLSARAPALSLPDLEGRTFSLDSLRGSKVLLVAWASW